MGRFWPPAFERCCLDLQIDGDEPRLASSTNTSVAFFFFFRLIPENEKARAQLDS